MKRIVLALLNSLSLLGVIILNALAGSGTLFDNSVGEISRQYDNLFTPAGYAFSIWGLIYAMLVVFVVFQWVSIFRKKHREVIDQAGLLFFVSNLANASWLFLWLSESIGYSVLAMFILLSSLLLLMYKLKLETWDAPVRIIFFVWWPIAFYLGWIIVASVANVAAFLTSINWEAPWFSPEVWTILMIAVAMLLYLLLLFTRNLRESAAVGVWALVAIAWRQAHAHVEISAAAGLVALILLLAITYHAYQNRKTAPLVKLRKGEF